MYPYIHMTGVAAEYSLRLHLFITMPAGNRAMLSQRDRTSN